MSNVWNVSDYMFVMVGSLSSGLEFISYSLTLSPSYQVVFWIAPLIGQFTNAQIALRSFPTKIVAPDENGN